MKRYLTDRQIGEMLGGKSVVTIWRMRKRGQLPLPRKLNGQNLTPEDEVQSALDRLFEQVEGAA